MKEEFTLESILQEWEIDKNIDAEDISFETLKGATIDFKYLKLLAATRKKINRLNAELKMKKSAKTRFYRKESTPEDLEKYKWDPETLPKDVAKSYVEKYLKIDEELIVDQYIIDNMENIYDTLDRILKEIRNRDWRIKNYIDNMKYKSGMN